MNDEYKTHYVGDSCVPPHEPIEDKTVVAFEDMISQASAAYDEWCQRRHQEGAEKYGPVKFLEANTFEEAMAEVVDLGNYARYTFIRLYLLNQSMDSAVGTMAFGDNKFVFNRDKIGG
jgi:hypothetical protein